MVAKNQSESVEFFTPKLGLSVEPYIAAGSKQGIHHIGRYQWACGVLKARQVKNVLDIACGAGYGSKILATALPDAKVQGSDYDERAVTHASATYDSANLRYAVGDMVTWMQGAEKLGRFDAVVSFDTIEHLLYRELALMRIADNLEDDGVLLLSTPCGHTVTRLNPAWEHHKVEYSHSDLFGLLSRFFTRVIRPQDDDFIGGEFWTGVINAGAVRYVNRMNPVICVGPIRTPKYQPNA
jgi:cyclopropane fatty-acyl-phospholipid synthase-like methyltransferase